MSSPSPLHPPESVRRFTSVKIGIVLLLILLLAFCGVRRDADDGASQQPLPQSGIRSGSGADSQSPSPDRQVTEAVPLPVPGQSEQQDGNSQNATRAQQLPGGTEGEAGSQAKTAQTRQGAVERGSVLKPATGDAMIELPTPLAFSVVNDPNGSMRLTGEVPDDTTRDHWMNDARLGARGVEVGGDLRLGRVDPASAAPWEGRLSALVAMVRERHITELRVRGDQIELFGQAASQQEADETLRLIRAQAPDSYRVMPRFNLQGAPSGTPSGAASQAVADKRARQAGNAAAPASGGTGASGQQRAATAGSQQAASRQRARNCPASVRSLAVPVYFNSGSASLSNAERRRLNQLGACLGSRARVRLTGHADPTHTSAYNKSLSERRARAVASAITSGGFPAARVTIIAAGQQRASRQNPRSEKAMRQSRRVDIRVN